jgi:hypothetical protein
LGALSANVPVLGRRLPAETLMKAAASNPDRGPRDAAPPRRTIVVKPTYDELLETLFDVTQALHHTLVQAGQMTSADKDQRWTITHKAEGICNAGGHPHYRQ